MLKELKEMVEYIARAVVDNPTEVSVEAVEDENEKMTTLRLKVAPADLGRVIGRQGRTARAIRTLIHAIATKAGRRAILEIVE